MHRKLALLLFAVVCASAALAHPMGNFSISHYSKLEPRADGVELRYIIDVAEIPTFQEMQQYNFKADTNDPRFRSYLQQKVEQLISGLELNVGAHRVPLHLRSRQEMFSPGAGGMPTMKIGLTLWAPVRGAGVLTLHFRDLNFPERAGWKEVVAVGNASTLLRSSVPASDRSHELADYPTDLLNSPPQVTEAELQVKFAAVEKPSPSVVAEEKIVAPIATPSPAPQPSPSEPVLAANRQARGDRFTELIRTSDFSFWFLVTAGILAAGLGALHALEPGHGKTIVAAYLVGNRGTAWHAVLLGLVVTASHTAGVYVLAGITMYASRYIVPEKLYPILSAFSGVIIAGLGIVLILRHLTGAPLDHSHDDGVAHSHWFTFKPRTAPAEKRQTSLAQLTLLGITGGIIPCPAALVVLLSAFSLHRIGFGLFLVAAFSAGLAAVLITVGLLMVYARRAVSRWQPDRPLFTRWLPLSSAIVVTLVGLALLAKSVSAMGFASLSLRPQTLLPAVTIIGLGFLLGIRHSTDPDHVVAVSTIVSRESSVGRAAVIGIMWGLGHTLTIMLVGGAIIVFGFVIPPRLGLGLELCVACMLVLLGIMSLRPQRMAKLLQKHSERESTPQVRGYRHLRPLSIGIVHGLAGSAAVALLVLSTIRTPVWAISYLFVFGVGTIAGMVLMTAAIAIPFTLTGRHFVKLNSVLVRISAVVSLAFGSLLIYELGFVAGFFTTNPHWTPR